MRHQGLDAYWFTTQHILILKPTRVGCLGFSSRIITTQLCNNDSTWPFGFTRWLDTRLDVESGYCGITSLALTSNITLVMMNTALPDEISLLWSWALVGSLLQLGWWRRRWRKMRIAPYLALSWIDLTQWKLTQDWIGRRQLTHTSMDSING